MDFLITTIRLYFFRMVLLLPKNSEEEQFCFDAAASWFQLLAYHLVLFGFILSRVFQYVSVCLLPSIDYLRANIWRPPASTLNRFHLFSAPTTSTLLNVHLLFFYSSDISLWRVLTVVFLNSVPSSVSIPRKNHILEKDQPMDLIVTSLYNLNNCM